MCVCVCVCVCGLVWHQATIQITGGSANAAVTNVRTVTMVLVAELECVCVCMDSYTEREHGP